MALYDADQKYYYLKRFQLEASQKLQNILGDNPDSQLLIMSDKDYPRLQVNFGGHDSYREALEVDAEEFIGVKSYKARGKRLTTFEVGTITELEPLRFKTPEAGDDNDPDDEDPDNDGGDEENPVKPPTAPASELSEEELDQQRLIDEITGQMTLF